MKKLIITTTVFISFACGNAPRPVANSNTTSNPQKPERTETVIAHTTENQTPRNNSSKSKWTQSGDPIDTKEFDAAIDAAQKLLKAKQADPNTKKALGEAYLKRAVALTDARQYASALGDYRRVLKYDPDNPEAREWIEQIISIYESMGRESPKEGEEPPPLPFKGEK
jgi:tetratricopeptide (TPR) repeat protein